MESMKHLANNEKLASEALARVKDQLAALLPEQLELVNLDVQTATSTILGALPEIRGFRERIVKELPRVDLVAFDNLEDYVLALSAAHASYVTATQPPDDLELLSTEAAKLREMLLAEAKSLSLRGLVNPRKLDNLKGANGRMNVAQDLLALSTLLLDSWPQVQGKSPTTQEELQAASRIGTRLTRVVGLRDQGPAVVAAATDQRQRAFTLLLNTYEEARLAIGYLRRREDDVESIAPSLYPGKARRRATEDAPTKPAAGTSPTGSPSSEAPSDSANATTTVLKPSPASKDPFLS